MADTLILDNSIWPNGMVMNSDNYQVFSPLGTIKVAVPTSSLDWPKGDKLISPFVYNDGKLVGFVDTKALTVSNNTMIYLPYEHIEAEFSSINKGQLQIYAPKATVKKASWKNSGKEDISEVQFKYKGCKTVNEVKTVNSNYKTTDIVNGVWNQPLWDLEQGGVGGQNGGMFYNCSQLTSFTSDLSSMTDGYGMFYGCSNLTTFTSDLSSMTEGYQMFNRCSKLTTFTSDLSSLTIGSQMFYGCSNLTSFSSDLSSLTNGQSMFWGCDNLSSFSSDLSSLKNGTSMFAYCRNLTSFSSNLSSLIMADSMFIDCKLDTASVQNIADTIKTVSNKTIHIGIGNYEPNEQEEAAFNTIASKGWTVYVNGSQYTPTAPATITTLDENGEETVTPIPYWAKPVPATEETATYTDEQGNFFNILGGQFIYGDSLETYGMFTCEADAAAQMCLTKIEKGDK